MGPAPAVIYGLPVRAFSPIDARHQFVGNERRWVDRTGNEVLYGPAAGLVICGEAGGSVFLVGCDRNWRPLWETACTTVEVAERQAEFEYPGVSRTWVRPGYA